MTNFMIYLILTFMFMFSCITFISKRKHLLCTLLSLEFMVLILFLLMLFYLSLMSFQNYFSMYFLSFCVCEGVLGLSILVSMIRTHGNDYFQSFNILQC